ncbi:glycine-rich domain-containing protein [Streptomyces sp. NPDC021100]|uniref:glycine-rich domain-containing protein n=1 Tax=Streptomyces sp. NPDC021100 TaxID=3365114 RepID=UPI00379199C4
MPTAVRTRDPRTFMAPEVWERQVRLIMRDHGVERGLAERTLGQTVAFLVTSAERPEVEMAPAPRVDLGVHSFVLDTVNYTDFCRTAAGRYVHHVPRLPEGGSEPPSLKATVRAVKAAGFAVDHELWNATEADCSQCHAGCTDSPAGGK